MKLTKKQLAEARRIIASRAGKASAKLLTVQQRIARAAKASKAAAEARRAKATTKCETCKWRESEIGYYSPCPAHTL